MKQNKLLGALKGRWFLFLLLMLFSFNLSAKDFIYEGVTYSVLSEEKKTCSLKECTVKGDVILPSEPEGYTLIEIGSWSFRNNDELVSVILPETITSIGMYAFSGCSSLSSINLPESITSLEYECFKGCSSLEAINLPETITSIGKEAFSRCSSLTSITIPNSSLSIGELCFAGCTGLSSIVIPAKVKEIGSKAFSGCRLCPLKIEGTPKTMSYTFNGELQYSSYTSLEKGSYIVCLPKDVNTIKKICNVNVYPDTLPYFPVITQYVRGFGIQLHKSEAYDKEIDDFSISVTRRSNTSETETISGVRDEYLFKDLRANTTYTIGMKWKDLESGEEMSYSFEDVTLNAEFKWKSTITQTSIIIESLSAKTDITFEPTGYEVIVEGIKYNVSALPITISNLYPETEYDVTFNAVGGEDILATEKKSMNTHSWNCKVQSIGKSPTAATVTAAFTEEDAKPDNVWWTCGGTEVTGKSVTFVSLTPNENQSLVFYIKYKNKSYQYPLTVKTDELKLTTLKPKCVSETCAIVAAETNISDVEPSVGFEWKKYDAPASLPASEGYGVVCEGMLEGYIKNLQPTSFYNVRPFYKSGEGKYYYGDWITFDPSDFSYFEPTIRTYPVQDITENSATVRGYVLQGTDDIISQGFQYWITGGKKTKGNAPSASDITTIVATGQVMTVTLEDLEAGTDYAFRVFVETKAGYTYGDEQQFTTEGVASIVDIDDEIISPTVVGYYDMMGVRSDKPHKGLNIVVYSNGTSKKVIK